MNNKLKTMRIVGQAVTERNISLLLIMNRRDHYDALLPVE
jgi:hypothetical protein